MVKTSKRKRESKLLNELCRDRHYMFQGIKRESDRYTTQFTFDRKTKKTTLTPAVCIKLVVPLCSDLGKQIEALYDKKRSK